MNRMLIEQQEPIAHHPPYPIVPHGARRLEDFLQPLSLLLEIRASSGGGNQEPLLFASRPEPLLGPLMDHVFTTTTSGGNDDAAPSPPYQLESNGMAPCPLSSYSPSRASSMDLVVCLTVIDTARGEVAYLHDGISTGEDGDHGGSWDQYREVSMHFQGEDLYITLGLHIQWRQEMPSLVSISLDAYEGVITDWPTDRRTTEEKYLLWNRMLGTAFWVGGG